jgi:hypothetical protein
MCTLHCIDSTMFLYTLQLEGGRWYIGTTSTPISRLLDHRRQRGSAWTRLHPVVGGYVTLKKISTDDEDKPFIEDLRVKTMMLKHGVDVVRGGSYSNLTLTDAQICVLTSELRHASGMCIRCGKSGHFASFCVDIQPRRATAHLGHTVDINPVRKTGGSREGKWRICVSGPKVTGVSGIKTLYSNPDIESARKKVRAFLRPGRI